MKCRRPPPKTERLILSNPLFSLSLSASTQNRFHFDAALKPLLARLHHVQVSKPAPDFKGTAVVNGAFKEIKLADYKGKYVYLFFYPLDL